jgi:glutamyl-tRNA reductase
MQVLDSTVPVKNSARHDVSLGLLGVNYRSTPLAIREGVARSLAKNTAKLKKAKANGLICGAAVISTCNRSEIVFSAEKENLDGAASFFKGEIFSGVHEDAYLPGDDVSRLPWYFHQDVEVSRHMFTVATGLDSMITGEAQILGQLKFAYRNSVCEGLAESSLHRLFQSAFRTAKLVRTATGIGRGTVSIASASKLAIESIYGDLSRLTCLIIGAGDTASLISRYLRDAGATSFFVANRTREKSRNLSDFIDGVHIPLSGIREVLPHADVVISAVTVTDPGKYVLSYEALDEIFSADKSKKYVVLDVSVPRSVDPRVQEFPSVYLFDIDDFAAVRDSSLEFRQKEAERAEVIIREQVSRYSRWIEERERYFLIRELIRTFSNETAREWIRTSRKLRKHNFSDETIDLLSELLYQHQQSVFFRFMHPVFSSLRGSSSEEMYTLVRELFASSEMPYFLQDIP